MRLDNFGLILMEATAMEKQKLKSLQKLRGDFVKDYSAKEIAKMEKEDYVVGKGENTFCYRLEYQLKEVGDNRGSTSKKFGVWFGKLGDDSELKYRHTDKFGKDVTEAFTNVKQEIIKLIELEPNNATSESIIINSKFSPLVMGKILYLYHPDSFIPVYSTDDMEYFIECCGEKITEKENYFTLQNKLFICKNKNDKTKAFDNLEFSEWLYDCFINDPEDEADAKLMKQLNQKKYPFKIRSYKGDLPEKSVATKKINNVEVYPRKPQKSINALVLADFKCEYSEEHKSFIRKNRNITYTEAHHLIPLKFYMDFDKKSLDVEANIVSLCSECHNKLHYGKDIKEILTVLYNQRKERLKTAGIDITFEKLFKYYEVE